VRDLTESDANELRERYATWAVAAVGYGVDSELEVSEWNAYLETACRVASVYQISVKTVRAWAREEWDACRALA
jgi:hypothetical protein